MPDSPAAHCPFLNRTDARCGANFTIDNLDHAFAHCFDRYQRCPTYAQILLERRERRENVADLLGRTPDARDDCAIQVTVRRCARTVANAARVSVVSRV